MQRVAFAWTHDAVLAHTLPLAAARDTGKDLSLFRADATTLRVALYRALLRGYSQREDDYQGVLAFAPSEQMTTARAPIVRKVRDALRGLDERQRLIIGLVDLGGCSYLETTRILGLSRTALLESLCNARAQLKSQLLGLRIATQADTRRRWGA
jgi:DNA-directed RNA polymerase specialized sigma24 family protein